ncbi:[cytidine(C)-cytidine(C)-adenosine (A)]-adding enzyme [Pleurocapsa sp. CCALA 161]|uniref:CCA tRNA nucleotidyltransferase n=1 Tax=Pleurocapsa sp. CCALA 161 TaxID=2107688 RepID=UPI000D06A8D3|nr:CCA tRNA nucleotidyltransferase [Pleurocapsa sp. CCALA 161]PSB06740.1 [cytidine(C)-cytidine(C)-adenosine (A)]-adding enzyme [Pleurocapsa sp. CCALA 161]
MSIAKIKLYLAQVDFPGDLAQLPDRAYLVGGSVRDALLQRYKIPLDLDFVLPEKAIPTAKRFARLYQGGFVVLDEVREIARVVFEQGTLDLANQEGASLETDLNRRDFTINAIAYNLKSQQLVDPLGGLADLEQGVLRMVAVKNLEDDPLRLLRAYRQSAQLNFTIEAETQKAIAKRASLLKKIAPERVQTELNYLFTAPQGNKWLAAAIEDGLLNFWLPNSHQVDLAQLDNITRGIKFCLESGLKYPALDILAKLSALVATKAEMAEAELTRLKYPRNQIKAITKTVKYLPLLQQITQQMSLREQYFWFLKVKDIFPILMARAIALKIPSQITSPLIERYLDPSDPVAHPQCLVTGNDLMRELNLKPARVIGELLTEIQIAQIESKVTTTQQAIDFANSILQSSK